MFKQFDIIAEFQINQQDKHPPLLRLNKDISIQAEVFDLSISIFYIFT